MQPSGWKLSLALRECLPEEFGVFISGDSSRPPSAWFVEIPFREACLGEHKLGYELELCDGNRASQTRAELWLQTEKLASGSFAKLFEL